MKHKSVWIYCRTANFDADALLFQQKLLKDYAYKCNMKVKGVTVEYGSGYNMKREGLDKVYKAAKNGKMDYVLVTSMTRLERVLLDTMEYINQLKKSGVQVICMDGITLDGQLGGAIEQIYRELGKT